ncbi:hypothetical protein F4604DRAFT_1732702 [Suillus subluteus]|nr:hypothetical protein F4604DRAFT_1732702 [Suillus subluteus]
MQLGDKLGVHVTLRTQLGDIRHLNAQCHQKAVCLQFLEAIEQHLNLIPPAERLVIEASVDCMIQELDTATVSSDPPDASPITLGSHVHAVTVGRPSIDVLPSDLTVFSLGRVSRRRMAELYHCHPRTTRRLLLEFNPSPPGPPVHVDEQQADGVFIYCYDFVYWLSSYFCRVRSSIALLSCHCFNCPPAWPFVLVR